MKYHKLGLLGGYGAKSVPSSSSAVPDSGEIFTKGVMAQFQAFDVAPGVPYPVEVGNVMQGSDGNTYAQKGGHVFQVYNAKPLSLAQAAQGVV